MTVSSSPIASPLGAPVGSPLSLTIHGVLAAIKGYTDGLNCASGDIFIKFPAAIEYNSQTGIAIQKFNYEQSEDISFSVDGAGPDTLGSWELLNPEVSITGGVISWTGGFLKKAIQTWDDLQPNTPYLLRYIVTGDLQISVANTPLVNSDFNGEMQEFEFTTGAVLTNKEIKMSNFGLATCSHCEVITTAKVAVEDYAITGASQSLDKSQVSYAGFWPTPVVYTDEVRFGYNELTGDYKYTGDMPLTDQNVLLNNCENPLVYQASEDALDLKIFGKVASDTAQLFRDSNNHDVSNPEVILNASSFMASVDLSGMSVIHGNQLIEGFQAYPLLLINPQICVATYHVMGDARYPIGSKVVFKGTDGGYITRTIISKSLEIGTDMGILVLDVPITSNIKYFKLPPNDFLTNYVSTNFGIAGIPLHVNMIKGDSNSSSTNAAHIIQSLYHHTASSVWKTQIIDTAYTSWESSANSGSPAFLILGNNLLLIGLQFETTTLSSFADELAAMQAYLDEDNNILVEYQHLNKLDLSDYLGD